ncbi:hypothetical protein N7490_001029 [Penicillium lividum]|nr:hypothetical protein N7490_001029 [Penicillium lividum]
MYLEKTRDHEKAFKYECLCSDAMEKLLSNGCELDYFDEAEDEGDVEKQPKPARCDGGKTCLCGKSASEHPGHPWSLTVAGFAKIRDMTTQVTVRDPENFQLTGYMDQSCIGLLQVMTNLIIDFLAAEGNWKEQWPLCEAMAIFHLRGDAASLALCEDAENIDAVYCIISYMFMSMLFNLQQARVLGPDSEVLNLGMIMMVILRFVKFRWAERIENEGEELTPYVLTYATKYKVDLVPKDDLEDLMNKYEAKEVTLPKGSENPWSVDKLLKRYMESELPYQFGDDKIGGDSLDVTAWTSAKRKKDSFDGKDPFAKADMDNVKKGAIISFQ